MARKPKPIRIAEQDDPSHISEGTTTHASDRDERPDGKPPHTPLGDRHAAGTPGGGSAVGGLAGTNIDEGSPQNDDLEKHEGSGVEDTVPGEDDGGPPYGGPSGGAVGGTPAGLRSSGGRTHGGLRPGGVHRGDSTIGTNPDSGTE
jgi:hypothetical protein